MRNFSKCLSEKNSKKRCEREKYISTKVFAIFKTSESTKKASWGDLGVILGRPGTVLRPLGAVLGRSWESPVLIKIDVDAMKKKTS